MEKWFKRRMEKMEYLLRDIMQNSSNKTKIHYAIRKLNKFKQKAPWKTMKVFDNPLIQQSSSGTSTPFSHYSSYNPES